METYLLQGEGSTEAQHIHVNSFEFGERMPDPARSSAGETSLAIPGARASVQGDRLSSSGVQVLLYLTVCISFPLIPWYSAGLSLTSRPSKMAAPISGQAMYASFSGSPALLSVYLASPASPVPTSTFFILPSAPPCPLLLHPVGV